jgi:hypothetical protein
VSLSVLFPRCGFGVSFFMSQNIFICKLYESKFKAKTRFVGMFFHLWFG